MNNLGLTGNLPGIFSIVEWTDELLAAGKASEFEYVFDDVIRRSRRAIGTHKINFSSLHNKLLTRRSGENVECLASALQGMSDCLRSESDLEFALIDSCYFFMSIS